MEIYEQILRPRGPLEVVSYIAAVRAAAVCRPFAHIIGFLNDCYEQHGVEVLNLVESVLRGVLYAKHRSPAQAVQAAEDAYSWLTTTHIRPTRIIMVRCCAWWLS